MKCQECSAEIAIPNVRFCPFCGADLSAARPEERRNAITVFADLSGFTALSQKHDPDTFRSLIDRVMKRFSAIVVEHGGIVDKIIGDAIMFLFGTERSSPDDPAQAMETMEQLRSELVLFREIEEVDLQLHIGAAFGMVSVGTVGSSRTVMGDSVNLASRLLGIGKAGETILSESLADLLGYGYQVEKLKPVTLKGIAEPVTPVRYVGKVSFHEKEPTFVGREKELRDIVKRVSDSLEKKEEGRLLLFGSAGMGKSRMLSSLREELVKKADATFTFHFEESGVAWHLPFRKLAETMMAWLGSEETSSKMRLWHFAQSDPGFWESVTLEQLQNLFLELFREVGSQGSILLFCEDLHRADASGRQLLEAILGEDQEHPISLVATSRQRHDLFNDVVELQGLSSKEALSLLRDLVGSEKADVEEALVRCAGNPLFVRELARGVRANLPVEKVFSGKIDLLIASSIDALQLEDQELVKRAAIFGSRVPAERLSRLANRSADECLERLQPLGMFYFLPAENALVFQHDLVRDAAYERTNLGVRKGWHGEIAGILENQKASPEEIAHHWLRSDHNDKAMDAAIVAGKHLGWLGRIDEAVELLEEGARLARASGNQHTLLEALEQRFNIQSKSLPVKEGLELLESIEGDSALDHFSKRSGSLALLRGKFLSERGMFKEARLEAEKAFEGLGGGRQVETRLLHANVLTALGEHKAVVRLAMETLRLDVVRDEERGELWNFLGHIAYTDRHFEEAAGFFEKSLKASQTGKTAQGEWRAHLNLGNVFFVRKDYPEASSHYAEAAQLALKSRDLVRYSRALFMLARVQENLLHYEESLVMYQQAIDALPVGYSEQESHVMKLQQAFLLRSLGDVDGVKTLVKECTQVFSEVEDQKRLGLTLYLHALVCWDRGDWTGALSFVERSLEVVAPYPAIAQISLVLKIDLLELLGRRSAAEELLEHLHDSFSKEVMRDSVRAEQLRLESVLSDRKDVGCLEEIRTFLCETKSEYPGHERLPLLVEALEYGRDPSLEAEGVALIGFLGKAFPREYRGQVDRKKEVVRFYELVSEELPATNES